jgi:hypothetical protein
LTIDTVYSSFISGDKNMALTNQKAADMARKALENGKTLQVPLYSGRGVVTAGALSTAVPYYCRRYAIYLYPDSALPRNGFPPEESYRFALDVAGWLVQHCGRSNVRKAVEKAEGSL